MLPTVMAWLDAWWPVLTVGSAIFGAVSLLATFVALPRVLGGLPVDYFHPDAEIAPGAYPVLRNLVGWPLLLLGILLIPLPGQGLLTVLAGLVLADVPGKRWLARLILRQGLMRRAVNAVRERRGAPPLLLP